MPPLPAPPPLPFPQSLSRDDRSVRQTKNDVGLPDNPLANNPGDPGLEGFLQADSESDHPVIGDADHDFQTGKFAVKMAP